MKHSKKILCLQIAGVVFTLLAEFINMKGNELNIKKEVEDYMDIHKNEFMKGE